MARGTVSAFAYFRSLRRWVWLTLPTLAARKYRRLLPDNLASSARKKASPEARPFAMSAVSTNCQMSWGRVFRLPLVTTQKRKSTRVKHRSRVVLITRKARGRAPRVLTAPFGLDRSPANDGPNGSDAADVSEYLNSLPSAAVRWPVADQRLADVLSWSVLILQKERFHGSGALSLKDWYG